MSAGPALVDPFALTANADAYVPRPATERAYEELERAVLDGARPVVLTGPAGIGKTLLLQRLVARVRDRLSPVYLPYASLAPDELCSWTLAVLNAETTDDPIGVFRAYIRHLRESSSGLLLVIDDATALPVSTARWIAHLAESSAGALRVALAAVDTATAGRTLAALGDKLQVIRLNEPMSEEETRRYLAARLDAAKVGPAPRALFGDRTVARLHRVSGGNPRRLHAAAAAVLRGESPEEISQFQDGALAVLEHGDDILAALERGADLPEAADELLAEDDLLPEAREPAAAPAAPPAPEAAPESERAPEVGAVGADTDAAPEAPASWLRPPAPRRVEPAPGLRWVLLAVIAVAAAAIVLPLLRARVDQPPPEPPPAPAPSAAIEPAPGPGPAFDPVPVLVPEPEPAPGAVAGIEPPPPPAPDPEPTAAAAPPDLGPFPVQINATPWAKIEIDGVDVGVTPLAGIPLLAGPHEFRATLPDGRVVERTVEIGADERWIVFE